MTKQTQGSMMAVGMIAGGIGFVAFVALMVVGDFAFSPALFLALVVAAAAAIFLFFGLHNRGDDARRDARRPVPTASKDGRMGDRTVAPGTAGVEPGTAGVPLDAGLAAGSAGAPGKGIANDAEHAESPATAFDASTERTPVETGSVQARPGSVDGPLDHTEEDRTSAAGHESETAETATAAPVTEHHEADTVTSTERDALAGEVPTETSEQDSDDTGNAGTGAAFEDPEKARMAAAEEKMAEASVAPSEHEPAPAEGAGSASSDVPPMQGDSDDGTVLIGTEPRRLSEPREGGADDLKRVKGVGPKIEQMLHHMGVFHYDQIASWTEREVAWVDENLEGFKGRVSRDNWVAQAKVLAEGGETEFSRRVNEGDVY
ncbi:putative flap endonuclease-1-like 5' DNA nuclease [Palleronia aestuarii]|uniref:Putative flap endonuclease-1-like 5' DNA nuclease n=1 Tax=Palleronia aestuarii TaxID=568105 RepID=A0A2W7NHE8_9RHOB|nr:hypothetical protein [Palleronia aestuarii]PZX17637.1 putative flap endonuclease-1-like 5' DNA nuclease [Palleronia aestuarii]